MKKIFTLFVAVLLTANVLAQAPQKMSYQAVIRNSSDVLVASATIGMKISILQGSALGTVVYSETQSVITNANGLATIEIGNGSVVEGTFATSSTFFSALFALFWTVPCGLQRRSSKALLITLTELNAIAAPATMGLSKPNAAKGIPTRL